MGNTITNDIDQIKMTTTSINLHNKNYIVEGDKQISFIHKKLILKYNNQNFATLNKKLKNNKTYIFYYTIPDFSFTYEYPEIINIVECFIDPNTTNNLKDNITCGIVDNIIPIGSDHKVLNCYAEVILKNNNDKIRLLIKQDENHMDICKEYVIVYNYLFYKNFYRITHSTLMSSPP
jgi:hypothetical protein